MCQRPVPLNPMEGDVDTHPPIRVPSVLGSVVEGGHISSVDVSRNTTSESSGPSSGGDVRNQF